MRPVVEGDYRRIRGKSSTHPCDVFKSTVQRLKQGDVVTNAQLARIKSGAAEKYLRLAQQTHAANPGLA